MAFCIVSGEHTLPQGTSKQSDERDDTTEAIETESSRPNATSGDGEKTDVDGHPAH
jgi:hypothetical protein